MWTGDRLGGIEMISILLLHPLIDVRLLGDCRLPTTVPNAVLAAEIELSHFVQTQLIDDHGIDAQIEEGHHQGGQHDRGEVDKHQEVVVDDRNEETLALREVGVVPAEQRQEADDGAQYPAREDDQQGRFLCQNDQNGKLETFKLRSPTYRICACGNREDTGWPSTDRARRPPG